MKDVEPLAQAIIRAHREGAKRGTLFSGEIVNDEVAAKNLKKALRGSTWLGGRFTRLLDVEECMCFRIDWDEWPSITE
jgi:hypothetical protein